MGTKRGGAICSVSHSRSLARPGIVAGILRPNPLPYLQGLLCLPFLADNECEGDKALTVLSYPQSNIAQLFGI